MWRTILAIVAALVAGIAVISAVQALNSIVFPLPPGLDLTDPAQMEQLMLQIPLSAMWGVELSYLLGSLACGAVLGWLAQGASTRLALVLGVLFTIMNLVNLSRIPHPLWMALLTTATFLPVIWWSARWVSARKQAR